MDTRKSENSILVKLDERYLSTDKEYQLIDELEILSLGFKGVCIVINLLMSIVVD